MNEYLILLLDWKHPEVNIIFILGLLAGLYGIYLAIKNEPVVAIKDIVGIVIVLGVFVFVIESIADAGRYEHALNLVKSCLIFLPVVGYGGWKFNVWHDKTA